MNPYQNNTQNNQTNNNNNNIIEDQTLQNAKHKLNDIQETYNNINNQAFNLTKGPANVSVYQREGMENSNLIPQSSNFLGTNFFASPTSPEYGPAKTSNINFYNVYQNTDNMNPYNNSNFDNSNYYGATPKQTGNPDYLLNMGNMAGASTNNNMYLQNTGNSTSNMNLFQNPNASNLIGNSMNNHNMNLSNMHMNMGNMGNLGNLGNNAHVSSTNFTESLDTNNNMLLQQTPRQYMHTQANGYFPDGIEPKLQNIVSTANFKCALDLREIALKAKNAEYNPKRFAAVIMRIREPKTTALIFASGKMVCTGARSEDESKTAAKQYARIIKKLGFPVKFSEFKIQNIVGSCDVKFPIRLEGLSNEHSRFCNYEPEMFPGLIYRMIKPKIVLLIFVSGKIVLTGAKERNDIFDAFKRIYPVLLTYKKKDGISTAAEQTSNSDE